MTTEGDPVNLLVESKNMKVAVVFQIYKTPSEGQFITPLLCQ